MNLSKEAREKIRQGAIHSNYNRKRRHVEAYSLNPILCGFCRVIIPYEKRRQRFCSHSCSAKVANQGNGRNVKSGEYIRKPCLVCGKITDNPKYCSTSCNAKDRHDKKINEIKTSGKLTKISGKKYLIEIRGRKCELCHTTEWQGKPVPLILDHISGDSGDWSLENLRIICPNCDALLPTYTGRNRGNGRADRRERYRKVGELPA